MFNYYHIPIGLAGDKSLFDEYFIPVSNPVSSYVHENNNHYGHGGDNTSKHSNLKRTLSNSNIGSNTSPKRQRTFSH